MHRCILKYTYIEWLATRDVIPAFINHSCFIYTNVIVKVASSFVAFKNYLNIQLFTE